MKKKNIIISAIIIVVATIILVTVNKVSHKGNSGSETTLKTTKIDVSDKIYINGEVKAVDSTNIYLDNTKGVVDSVAVTDGQEVQAGDLLFTYRNDTVTSQVEELTSQVTTYNSQKSRLESKKSDANNKLNDKKNTIRDLEAKVNNDATGMIAQELEQAKSEAQAYEQEIAGYDDQVATINDSINDLNSKTQKLKSEEKVEVKAEVKGIVRIVGTKDDYTTAYMKIDSSDFCVKGTVNEKNVAKVKKDQEAELLIIALDKTIKGKVLEVSREPVSAAELGVEATASSASSSLSSYRVVISVDSSEDLLTGYHVQATIKEKSKDIEISKKAIIEEDGKEYVFKVVDNKLVKTEVKTNTTEKGKAIVEGGLEDGDKIVTNPTSNTKEGMKLDE